MLNEMSPQWSTETKQTNRDGGEDQKVGVPTFSAQPLY